MKDAAVIAALALVAGAGLFTSCDTEPPKAIEPPATIQAAPIEVGDEPNEATELVHSRAF